MARISKLVLAVACVVVTLNAFAADWPQFGGPNADRTAPDKGINKDWHQKAPALLWTVPLSDDGFAVPSVADGKVFILDHEGDQDVVRALNLQTGEEVWRFSYPDAADANRGYGRAMPVFSEGRLYTLCRLGLLHCLDAATGDKIWSRDTLADFGGVKPGWGYAASPLVDGEKVIVFPGGREKGVAALNKLTGETIWTGGNADVPGYVTPVVATILGKKQYVVVTGVSVIGVEAETGDALWRAPWGPRFPVNIAQPIVQDSFIFVSSGYGLGCGLIEVTDTGAVFRWTSKEMQSHINAPILYNGAIYGNSDPDRLVCLSPMNGTAFWKQEGFEKGGLVLVDDVIIALDGDAGDAVMVKATHESYQELGRFKPLGGQSWTPPIVADGKLIVRNAKAMACLDLM